jgi:two-component system OmpR family response regulator
MGGYMQLLLIEDSRDIAAALKQVLAADYDVTVAHDGQSGLRQAGQASYDLILLDILLPDLNGLEICETLRADGNTTPIMILTGETSIMSKIRFLDAGADDYLTKPFSVGELKARLRSLQRRQGQLPSESPELTAGGLRLNRTTYRVERDGQTIRLRRKEFALLECLMRHADTVVTRSTLGNYAWHGADMPWTNTIDVHIKHLRDKIDRPFDKTLIRTVHGVGYRFESTPRPAVKKLLNQL